MFPLVRESSEWFDSARTFHLAFNVQSNSGNRRLFHVKHCLPESGCTKLLACKDVAHFAQNATASQSTHLLEPRTAPSFFSGLGTVPTFGCSPPRDYVRCPVSFALRDIHIRSVRIFRNAPLHLVAISGGQWIWRASFRPSATFGIYFIRPARPSKNPFATLQNPAIPSSLIPLSTRSTKNVSRETLETQHCGPSSFRYAIIDLATVFRPWRRRRCTCKRHDHLFTKPEWMACDTEKVREEVPQRS